MNPEEKKIKPPLEETLKSVRSLRTYQGDVEEAILKNNYSSTSIFLAEQKIKGFSPQDNFSQKSLIFKNNLFIILGTLLFILGISVVGIVYYTKSNEKMMLEQKTKDFIGFSEEKKLSVATTTREKFVNQLIKEKESFDLPVNSVLYINTVNGNGLIENIENLFTLLAPKMPGSLVRSFNEKYMLGIYSFGTNEPFIILSVEDFALSFAGMLKWEKDMVLDVGKLFGINRNASSSISTFVDEERRNKDLRVLKDSNDNIILLYSFIDSDTLLITKNESVFGAILSKFLISRQEK